jgi:AraC-like DNA-binding protein
LDTSLESPVPGAFDEVAALEEGADLKRFVRDPYTVSETHPVQVAFKLHPATSDERFDMHYALELGIVLSGRMERIYQGYRRMIEAGQVWLCGAWEPHGWRVTAGPCRAVVVTIFPPMLLNAAFREIGSFDWMAPFTSPAAGRPDVPRALRKVFKKLACDLARSIDMPPPRKSVMQRVLLYQLLLQLPVKTKRAAPPEPVSPDSYATVNRAVELVFQRRSYLTSDEAAQACALGLKSFNRLFEKVMGVSFPRFSLRFRLQGVATRLLESREPLKAIARDWGFVDVSHLHASFRAAYGCSPGQYRRGRQLMSTSS